MHFSIYAALLPLTTLHARCDALQTVLLATVVALGKSSKQGAQQIEQHALKGAEAMCLIREKSGSPSAQIDEYRHHVETILMAARAALTGKAQ